MSDLLEKLSFEKELEAQKSYIIQESNSLGINIESEINAAFYLISGLVSYIQMEPDFSKESFDLIAENLIKSNDGLRNIAAAPDLVIQFIYPLEGNEAALGFDYHSVPEQVDSVLSIVESGLPKIAGPVDLVQGGRALIGRYPVYLEQGGGNKKLWGLISTPLDLDVFYKRCGIYEYPGLNIAIMGKDGLGLDGDYFFGDASIEEFDPISVPVHVFDGEWIILAVPKDGWITQSSGKVLIYVFVGIVTFSLLFTYFMLLRQLRISEVNHRQSLQQYQEKSLFLASMSHDIRAPISIIQNCLFLINRDWDKDEEQDTWFKAISDSAEYLEHLMDGLLELNRIDSGHWNVTEQEIIVSDFLDRIERSFQVVAGKKKLDFIVRNEIDDKTVIVTDEIRVKQILWNLLTNAFKFTNKGSIELVARIHDQDPLTLGFTIKDSGRGIESDKIREVFDAFSQESESIQQDFGGFGLGLSIVKRFCNDLNGKVNIESETGVGTVFNVSIPVKKIA